MATALCVLSVAACGGSAEDAEAAGASTGGGGPETTDVSVGVQPFAEVSAFYVAMQEGLFEDEGLTVTPQVAGGGGAGLIPGLVSGEQQFAYSNYVSVVQAASEGLPLKVVRENDRPGVQGLYTLPNSGISAPADLAGKRIAINGLGNIMELTTRAALDDAGVDPDSVTFVELPPPDFLTALGSGNVDAAWLVEPFVSIGTDTQGAQLVLDVFAGPTEDLPVAGWVTSAQFAAENPETVAAFERAMDAAVQMVADDPALVGEVVPTYTQLPPEVAAGLNPIAFAVESEPADISQVEELMREYGFIEEQVDTGELVLADD
ncbi:MULTISPECIES: ABC transporter substrate-binding protein [unclassified Geodermatophilus]|uniref:ABC transporter substrate-binding protein n=1 Tax=unclassified Geodermatophilus TaxID=2637632 RepID=UPI003EEFE7AC